MHRLELVKSHYKLLVLGFFFQYILFLKMRVRGLEDKLTAVLRWWHLEVSLVRDLDRSCVVWNSKNQID